MDYPDSDEEYELMHAAELEAMHEMEEDDCFSPPPTSSKPKSKRSLDFHETSTPSTSKKKLAPDPPESSTHTGGAITKSQDETLNSSGVSVGCTPLPDDETCKRSAEELFGDISDLDNPATPFDFGRNKRPRLEPEVELDKEVMQDLLISKIVEMRKKTQQFLQPVSSTSSSPRSKKPEDSMTCRVPQWPFMPVAGHGQQRIYLRLRTQEYFAQEVGDIALSSKQGNFLSVPFYELKIQAKKELDKMEKRRQPVNNEVEVVGKSKDLLVERYKPRSYLELLSDEGTNRSLLQWLKLWDKIVFNRNVPAAKQDNNPGKENWKNQKYGSRGAYNQLNTDLDDHNRPQAKIALLCGPPGLGKTTLAHLIAVQAGYNVVEVNASDDRSPQAFRTQLEASTQMKSVMGEEKRPNCLILDEIDGAPPPAIDVLVGFATDREAKRGKGKNKKAGASGSNISGLLRRPIICICNDVYVPALRPLRQIAFTLHFPPTSSARLGERLVEICKLEGVKTDLGCMVALGEKTHNDIRACLSVLHCIKAKTNKVSLTQIQSTNVGIKDMQQGLFTVWQGIFQIVKPKTKVYISDGFSKDQMAGAHPSSDSKCDDSTQKSRMASILKLVHGCGDYDKLVQGVYENFPLLNTKSISFTSLALALKWFTFHDIMNKDIHSNQNFVLYPYLLYGFVVWHFVFGTFAWPKLTYPHVQFEMSQRSLRRKQQIEYCLEGSSAHVRANISKDSLLLDCIPYILDIINPNLRTLTSQLLSDKEKEALVKVVSVMIDYNLNYTQERNQDGVYTYNLDPNLEEIGRFSDWKAERSLTYAGKQLISREIDLEKMRRAETALYKASASSLNKKVQNAPKQPEQREDSDMTSTSGKEDQIKIPSHLQKLTPKAVKAKPEKMTRDFFGRIVVKKESKRSKVVMDEIVKSDVWFSFKEGHNNAVRRTLYMEDLLRPSKWNTF